LEKVFVVLLDAMGQKFGQHFLHDQEVLSRTAEEIDRLVEQFESTHVIEIGPGRGALTKHLMKREYGLILNEVDTSLQ
jgi:16S rRNA (adenine1518-N6/adenine1519-N6)-dimethyltransferase